ncbi:hypothetical protein EWM64_g6409 [Hericium alpestre]|uniref:Uncharacterized protein n=1 Tax=Hericium alpestre TaxID=135208 RepID=A0A4Y9ZSR6_9AGAM|nr:hypothetical protein EWM64_g6409 [Hericium alpestre]
MPAKSKANRARARNLRSRGQTHRDPTPEIQFPEPVSPDDLGSDLEAEWDSEWDENDSPALTDVPDDDSDLEVEPDLDEEEKRVQNEADLAAFNNRLRKGLADALAIEKHEKQEGKKRRGTRYDGFGKRTTERKRARTKKEADNDERRGFRQMSLAAMFRSSSAPSEPELSSDCGEVSARIVCLSKSEGLTEGQIDSSQQDLLDDGTDVDEAESPDETSASQKLSALMDEYRAQNQMTDTVAFLPTADAEAMNISANQYHHEDKERLRRARNELTKLAKSKKLDVLFRSRINLMVGSLNLFLNADTSFSWREASAIVAKTAERKESTARSIRDWIHAYLKSGKLPLHQYGRFSSSILEEEDFAQQIQLHLLEIAKDGYVRAQDIVDYVAKPEIQEQLSNTGRKKTTISVRTAQRWLHKMSWRYGKKKNGMYIDGHEREDVVDYRNNFVIRWKEYEQRMVHYDQDGNASAPTGFPVPQGPRFRLYLITHDESTFYQNDRRRQVWSHPSQGPTPQPKGDGESLMVSDFLCPDLGRLVHECQEARIFFRAGNNRDGWFNNGHLLAQTEKAIDIFEALTHRQATGLFMFDNALNHKKRADDALSSTKMPKRPKCGWSNVKDGPKMRDGILPDGTRQPLYFSDDHPTMPGWFKGMEVIIRERGLWPDNGLPAACVPRCNKDGTDCCCRRVLYHQADFAGQKSALEELIERRGHICDFYPKFHCELNFIEQYWGAAKLRYRISPRTSNFAEMERNIKASLDDVPLLTIRRYANRSARFISAYGQGLSGPQAAWANRRYHGHRVLPPEMVAEVKKSLPNR